MLKYSTGRGKPGWGKESCKPVWWPEDIPWANVRSDVRTEEQKQRVREIPGLQFLQGKCFVLPPPSDDLCSYETSILSVSHWDILRISQADSLIPKPAFDLYSFYIGV